MIGLSPKGGAVNDTFNLLAVISDPDAYKAKLQELAHLLEGLEKAKRENARFEAVTRAELERREKAVDERERQVAELEVKAEAAMKEAAQIRDKYEEKAKKLRSLF